eukprot:8344739-Pyramimonas_sp.AAC.1
MSVSSGSDRWERDGNKLRLVFTKPRRAMPVKKDLSESPVPSSFLEDEMATTCRFKNPDGTYVEHIFEGSVSDLEDDAKLMPDYWVGHVEFQVTAPPVQDSRGGPGPPACQQSPPPLSSSESSFESGSIATGLKSGTDEGSRDPLSSVAPLGSSSADSFVHVSPPSSQPAGSHAGA